MEDDLELIDYHSWIGDNNNGLSRLDCGVEEINAEFVNEVEKLKDYSSKNRAILLVNRKNEVLGFVVYSLENASMIQVGGKTGTKSYPTLYINLLGVDKNNYKKGYGSQLVVAVIRMTKTIDVFAHIDGIQLHSLEDSVGFYKKLGFSEVREYYPGRVDGSKMHYNIDKLRKIDFLRVYMNPFSISDDINKITL